MFWMFYFIFDFRVVTGTVSARIYRARVSGPNQTTSRGAEVAIFSAFFFFLSFFQQKTTFAWILQVSFSPLLKILVAPVWGMDLRWQFGRPATSLKQLNLLGTHYLNLREGLKKTTTTKTQPNLNKSCNQFKIYWMKIIRLRPFHMKYIFNHSCSKIRLTLFG